MQDVFKSRVREAKAGQRPPPAGISVEKYDELISNLATITEWGVSERTVRDVWLYWWLCGGGKQMFEAQKRGELACATATRYCSDWAHRPFGASSSWARPRRHPPRRPQHQGHGNRTTLHLSRSATCDRLRQGGDGVHLLQGSSARARARGELRRAAVRLRRRRSSEARSFSWRSGPWSSVTSRSRT